MIFFVKKNLPYSKLIMENPTKDLVNRQQTSEVLVSDINNLQNLQQHRSKLHIKVDPTITCVSEIEFTHKPTGSANDSDEEMPPQPNHQSTKLCPQSCDLDQLCFDAESPLNTERAGTERSDIEQQHSTIKIPSVYVQDRFRDLDDQVHNGRRTRSVNYYKNCIGVPICNIAIFYILFVIGVIMLRVFGDFIDLDSIFKTNATKYIGCQCNDMRLPGGSGSNGGRHVRNITEIRYIPIPPKFWDQRLENLTQEMYNMVDVYFATVAADFVFNSSGIIVNKTIDLLQIINISKLTVGHIVSNTLNSINIDTTNLSSKLIKTVDITAENVKSVSLYGDTLNKCNVGKC